MIHVENDITQNLLQLKRKFMTVNTFDVERFKKKYIKADANNNWIVGVVANRWQLIRLFLGLNMNPDHTSAQYLHRGNSDGWIPDDAPKIYLLVGHGIHVWLVRDGR